MALLRCGLYRTTATIGGIPPGRLVYFHDHGSPGPGVYLPQRWEGNRARFAASGTTLEEPERASELLEPVAAEGLYRVATTFFCCAERCREFRPEMLVQLGYDAAATPILFVPELAGPSLELPTRGTRIDRERIAHLSRLEVPTRGGVHESGEPELLH
jgi:hypothetical protein